MDTDFLISLIVLLGDLWEYLGNDFLIHYPVFLGVTAGIPKNITILIGVAQRGLFKKDLKEGLNSRIYRLNVLMYRFVRVFNKELYLYPGYRFPQTACR